MTIARPLSTADRLAALSANIAAERERAGLSQNRLAAAMGVDRSLPSRWESGERRPNYAHLIALAEYFDTTIDALLGGG